jgi:hypothetical protein
VDESSQKGIEEAERGQRHADSVNDEPVKLAMMIRRHRRAICRVSTSLTDRCQAA